MTLRTVWELQPSSEANLVGTLLSIGAGKQDLRAAQGEGI
jgi:hypothetical protein